MGLLEDLGIRRPYDGQGKIGGRRPPKDFGELRFEEWLYILQLSPEGDDGSKAEKRAVTERQYFEGTSKQKIGGADCQTDDLNDTAASRLNGYIRTNFYSDDAGGKTRAKKRKAQLAQEYEGELNIQVRRVYCKDSRQWGWSVWVRPTGTRIEKFDYYADEDGKMVKKRGEREAVIQAPRSVETGGFGSSTVRSWTAYRPTSKKKVSCPKCFAPKGYPCVNDKGIEQEIYIENGKPMTANQASKYKEGRGLSITVRSVRTNPHRQRVDKYLEEKEGLIENPLTAREGDFIEKVERRPPTDTEKEGWITRNYNEGQFGRYEDLEEELGRRPDVEEMEDILNKKQRVKYDEWVLFGQPIDKEE